MKKKKVKINTSKNQIITYGKLTDKGFTFENLPDELALKIIDSLDAKGLKEIAVSSKKVMGF